VQPPASRSILQDMEPDFVDVAAETLADLPPPSVLYADVDGTLVGPGGSLLTGPDGSPSLRAASALVQAARSGLTVVLVSGRQRWQLQQDARILGLSDCVAEAGGVIVRAGDVAYQWGDCPQGLAANPHDALDKAGALALLLDAFEGDLRPYEPWHRGREGGHLLHGEIDVARANTMLAEEGLGWAKVIDNGATGGWEGRSVRAYHLVPNGVGKARGVAADLRARGVEPRRAAAVGDSPEDATIAGEVGVYFQVANGQGGGPDAIVTPGAMGDGFAQAVAVLLAARGDA
jgi:phosphoglycolate phosphatase